MEQRILPALMCCLLFATSGAVSAQQFKAGPGSAVTFQPGSWDGKYRWTNVYCVTLPNSATARSVEERLLNNDRIHLLRVEYPSKLMANIAISTIPSGRNADEEVRRLADVERYAENAYKTSYNITEFSTKFGRTLGLRIKDVAPAGSQGPFPLVRPLLRPSTSIQSLSVHRLFARGPDRFEVAVYQFAPETTTGATELEMTVSLTRLADEVVESLQSCTAQMPIRAD
jgi:hypothetical protein